VSVPSSNVTPEYVTDTVLQAVGYKLPRNTVQCPKSARNSYTALRKFLCSCLASTGFRRWATTVLRVYRIHFVGAIRVKSLNLFKEKEFDWQPLLPSVWSLESRIAKRICKLYYVFMHLYIVTSIRLSTGLLWTLLRIIFPFHALFNLFLIFINKLFIHIPIYTLPVVNHNVRKVLKPWNKL